MAPDSARGGGCRQKSRTEPSLVASTVWLRCGGQAPGLAPELVEQTEAEQSSSRRGSYHDLAQPQRRSGLNCSAKWWAGRVQCELAAQGFAEKAPYWSRH